MSKHLHFAIYERDVKADVYGGNKSFGSMLVCEN